MKRGIGIARANEKMKQRKNYFRGSTTSNQAALINADVATIPPATLRALIKHQQTDKGLEGFLADWEKPAERSGDRPDLEVYQL